ASGRPREPARRPATTTPPLRGPTVMLNRKPLGHRLRPRRSRTPRSAHHVPPVTAAALVGGAAIAVLSIAAHAILPPIGILSGAALLAAVTAVARPAGTPDEWLTAQLLIAGTLLLFGWDERTQLGAAIGDAAITIGLGFGVAAMVVFWRLRQFAGEPGAACRARVSARPPSYLLLPRVVVVADVTVTRSPHAPALTADRPRRRIFLA
ncbi:MAG TPA: hypothetical protein VFL67_05340, partial [Mycobacterium sp.]|nr:hypothetical protein [Mycobacterium sp.]